MTHEQKNPLFNATKFLHSRFGSAPGVVAFLGAYRRSVPLHTVQKWWQRNSIPGEWLGLLLGLLEVETGGPVGLAAFMGDNNA